MKNYWLDRKKEDDYWLPVRSQSGKVETLPGAKNLALLRDAMVIYHLRNKKRGKR